MTDNFVKFAIESGKRQSIEGIPKLTASCADSNLSVRHNFGVCRREVEGKLGRYFGGVVAE